MSNNTTHSMNYVHHSGKSHNIWLTSKWGEIMRKAAFTTISTTHYEADNIKSFTVNYKDGSSYTNKAISATVSSEEGKDQRVIIIEYKVKPQKRENNDDFTVEEVGYINLKLTLKASDVKSIDIRQHDRVVSLNKFRDGE